MQVIWVGQIKERPNEATHEIELVTGSNVRRLLLSTQLFLTYVYSFADFEPSPSK